MDATTIPGPPWLMITLGVISLLGIIATAVVGPALVVSVLVSVPLTLLGQRLAANTAADEVRALEQRAATASVEQIARNAYDLGLAANAELASRGLQVVALPAPGTAPAPVVLAAASTAQVAAGIARDEVDVPTPEQLRAQVAAALATLPPPPAGPAEVDVTAAVTAYLHANAAALRGPAGEPGPPGEAPPCLAEPAQCQGADGQPGARGEPPVGWTVEEADGSTTACQRETDFDPAAPRYQCHHTDQPAPTSTPPTTTTEPTTQPPEDGLLPGGP
ncbi:MAG: hypothetical protein ACRDTG_29145 [Pseudonocardiaceae bacterium]